MLPYSKFSRQSALPKDGPHRVYGLLGDAYLQGRVIDALLGWSLDADARDFNLDRIDGDTARVTDVLAAASNVPFLSERRAVIVARAERLENIGRAGESGETKSEGKSKVSPAARLREGVEKLPPTTLLILARTPETPEPGARSSTPRCLNANVDKSLEKTGLIIDCTVGPKDTGTAVAIVQNEAAAKGIPLAQGAAPHLVTRVGHDIARLLNELDKCALRAGWGTPVTAQVIDEMTRRQPQDTIFDLTDAIGDRKTPHAIALLRELMAGGEPPELILAMLVRHLRQLLQARAFLDAKLPLDASLANRLPAHLSEQLPRDGRENLAIVLQAQGWRGRRLASQARAFSIPQIEAALYGALEVDLAMKGIERDGGSPELLLELLVTKMG